MGDVIAFAEVVRVRRQRVAHALHARCRIIIAASVAAARADLAHAPTRERAVRSARLRKLEKLEAYALVLG